MSRLACLLAVAHAVSHAPAPDLDDDVPKFETLEYAVAIGPGGEAEFRRLETGMIARMVEGGFPSHLICDWSCVNLLVT